MTCGTRIANSDTMRAGKTLFIAASTKRDYPSVYRSLDIRTARSVLVPITARMGCTCASGPNFAAAAFTASEEEL